MLDRVDAVLRCGVKIRAFDGSLRDAQGIMEVDRATFGDCAYTPEHILSLESDPGQYAWVAEEGGRIIGFVSAFATHSLAASRWEVDELAVHPQAQGRGVGTALVACAVEEGLILGGLAQARSLVAVGNLASARVFAKHGFAPVATVHLMIYLIEGREPRPMRTELPAVRWARSGDRSFIASLGDCDIARIAAGLAQSQTTYLVAERDGNPLGYAELIHVCTLQYEGFWIESIGGALQEKRVASALLNGAIEEAKRHEAFDEVGYLALPGVTSLYEAAVGEGFKTTGEYRVWVREWSG